MAASDESAITWKLLNAGTRNKNGRTKKGLANPVASLRWCWPRFKAQTPSIVFAGRRRKGLPFPQWACSGRRKLWGHPAEGKGGMKHSLWRKVEMVLLRSGCRWARYTSCCPQSDTPRTERAIELFRLSPPQPSTHYFLFQAVCIAQIHASGKESAGDRFRSHGEAYLGVYSGYRAFEYCRAYIPGRSKGV